MYQWGFLWLRNLPRTANVLFGLFTVHGESKSRFVKFALYAFPRRNLIPVVDFTVTFVTFGLLI